MKGELFSIFRVSKGPDVKIHIQTLENTVILYIMYIIYIYIHFCSYLSFLLLVDHKLIHKVTLYSVMFSTKCI